MRGVSTERPRQGSTPITFSHPAVRGSLTIDGVYEIQWSYELITSSQATYGGEVVQILGAHVGPIQISGRSPNRREQERIRRWFVAYMQAAGLTRRSQTPVRVTYPERGWTFDIYPVALPWSVSRENFAPEWSVQAEMAANADGLAEATLSEFNYAQDFQGIGFSDAYNVGLFEDAQLVGENFNRLLASWMTGDYQQFGFNPFGDPSAFDKDTLDMYRDYFGSEWLIEPSGEGGDFFGGGEPTTKLAIVNQIVQTFEAKDMPGRLGVAVAILESTLNPDAVNSAGYMGLFQSQPGPTGKGQLTGNREAEAANLRKHEPGYKITEDYPASLQIQHASEWFKATGDRYYPDHSADTTNTQVLMNWAIRAQGVTLDNNPLFAQMPRFLNEAIELIEQAKEVADAAPGGSLPTESKQQLQNLILASPKITFSGGIQKGDIEAGRVSELTMRNMVYLARHFSYNVTSLARRSSGGIRGTAHGPGRAVDIGNVNGVITRDNDETERMARFIFNAQSTMQWKQLFSPIAKYNYTAPGVKHNGVYPGHHDHIHIGW